jgi:hypothetical protein
MEIFSIVRRKRAEIKVLVCMALSEGSCSVVGEKREKTETKERRLDSQLVEMQMQMQSRSREQNWRKNVKRRLVSKWVDRDELR